MAITRVSTSTTDEPSPKASKLQSFATALGILNTVSGLGAQAGKTFSAQAPSTQTQLSKGFALDGAPNPGALAQGLTSEQLNLYAKPVFGSKTNGLNPVAQLDPLHPYDFPYKYSTPVQP